MNASPGRALPGGDWSLRWTWGGARRARQTQEGKGISRSAEDIWVDTVSTSHTIKREK